MEFTGERFIPEKLKASDETYQEHMQRYQFACGYFKGLKVLDVACGAGYGTRILSDEAKEVFGVDIDAEAVQYAQAHYQGGNTHFEVMDSTQIKYPDQSFDAVVSFETIEHIPSPDLFLKEVKRILKPGGLFIISTPNLETVCDGKDVHVPFHVKEFTLKEMLEMLLAFKKPEVFAQKMSYHKKSYKKIRLFCRYVAGVLRGIITTCWGNKVLVPSKVALVPRIFLYEYVYPFTVIPYVETDPSIKPTFFVIVCRA